MKSSVRSVRMARKMRPCSVLSVHSILCAGCQRGHKRQKGTSFHELLSIEEALKGKMKASVVHCEKHPQQEINTYCHTDKRAICAECVVDSHVGHQVERLVNLVRGFKEEI